MKKKGHQKVVFKPYNMNQLSLPMSLESMIPAQHKVRVVIQVIEEMGARVALQQSPILLAGKSQI